MLARPAAAQNQPQPKLWSIDITPQFGYRTSMSLDAVSETDGAKARVRLDANPSYGFSFGVRYDDANVVEFRWARQDTQLAITGAVVVPKQRVVLDQYHFDFTHEFLVQGWPTSVRPFIIGSIGATRIASTANTHSFTRFSFGLGGGIKAFPTRHVGIRVQAEWLPLWVSPEVRAFCSVGCIVQINGQLVSQGEFTIGPVFRF